MRHSSHRMNMRNACAAVVLMLASASLAGQQFEVYRQFVWPGGGPGDRPTIGSDGNIYATGGSGDFGRGEIFRLVPDGSGGLTYERLYSFHGPDGAGPAGIIQGSDGRFYGVTTVGRPVRGWNRLRLRSRDRRRRRLPQLPVALLLRQYLPSRLIQASDGNFYGLTVVGGTIGFGTIFRVTPSGEFTEIHVFTGPDGERPWGPLIQASDGYLYGGAQFGGIRRTRADGPRVLRGRHALPLGPLRQHDRDLQVPRPRQLHQRGAGRNAGRQSLGDVRQLRLVRPGQRVSQRQGRKRDRDPQLSVGARRGRPSDCGPDSDARRKLLRNHDRRRRRRRRNRLPDDERRRR